VSRADEPWCQGCHEHPPAWGVAFCWKCLHAYRDYGAVTQQELDRIAQRERDRTPPDAD